MTVSISAIYRYPVKGLSPEPLRSVALAPGRCLPQDRRFAIALPATRFDSERPEWLAKTHFAMLMRDETLAQLQTRLDAEHCELEVERDGRVLLRACLAEPEGRRQAGEFFTAFLDGAVAGPLRFVEAPAEGLDLPIDMRGTPFQRRVWEELLRVPAGAIITYGALATRMGEPKAVRAVDARRALPGREEPGHGRHLRVGVHHDALTGNRARTSGHQIRRLRRLGRGPRPRVRRRSWRPHSMVPRRRAGGCTAAMPRLRPTWWRNFPDFTGTRSRRILRRG